MVILGELIAVLVINAVVNGERTDAIGPDQSDQTDPFDDLVLVAAPTGNTSRKSSRNRPYQ